MNEVLIRMESVDLVYFPPSLPGGWLGGGGGVLKGLFGLKVDTDEETEPSGECVALYR